MSPGTAPGLETQVLQPLHLPASSFLFSPSGPALPSGPKPVRVHSPPLSFGSGFCPSSAAGNDSSSTDQASASPLCSAGLLSLQGHLTELIHPTPAHSGLHQLCRTTVPSYPRVCFLQFRLPVANLSRKILNEKFQQ